METIYHNCIELGIACLVNLHQVEIAKKYSTRIIGIKSGKLVFDDTPDKLTDEMSRFIYEGKESEMYQHQ